jgi:broad specificity phosphatase PhoE
VDEDDQLWLIRHGATEWSRNGRHTGTTDLPLLPDGEDDARALRERLSGVDFSLVLTSPLQRARRTAELAGFPDADVDDDLVEWGYGEYEGITTEEIRETVPRWTVWTHPSPGGETAGEVADRLDRVLARVRAVEGHVLLVSHGHTLRGLAARWLGLPVVDGRLLKLDTGTISVLGYERETAVVERWNS